jgi:hypothetical protein
MSHTILQVNFRHSMTPADYRTLAHHAAGPLANVPGLQWKIWLEDAGEGRAGGLYLFESEAAATAYEAGPVISGLRASPHIHDLTAQLFDILPEPTAITRGPVARLLAGNGVMEPTPTAQSGRLPNYISGSLQVR